MKGSDGDYLRDVFAKQIKYTKEEIPEVWAKLSDIANVFPPKDKAGVIAWSAK